MRMLIFGASGLLGTALCRYLSRSSHDVLPFERSIQNPCDSKEQVEQNFSRAIIGFKPDVLINLIAATNVDGCETDLGRASFLNCVIPQILSDACLVQKGFRPHMIQLSSDQVYSGNGPHLESTANPLNVYALTKFLGEYPVLRVGGCVLRTNFFGKSLISGRASFSDWIIAGAKAGTRLNVFDDVLFSPVGFQTLCAAITRCSESRQQGLYNLGSDSRGISKAAFADLLLRHVGMDPEILDFVSVQSASLKAKRPKDMRMNSTLYARDMAYKLPSIEQEISNEYHSYME